MNYKNVCFSIVDAIARVYSSEAAEELMRIINGSNCEVCPEKMGETIYEVMAIHQSNPTVSDWSQSNRRSSLRTP